MNPDSLLTVIPYLMMSFIRSSSMVVRKVSLGWSIRGTTNSKILATLQMTMKSFWFCERKKSTEGAWRFSTWENLREPTTRGRQKKKKNPKDFKNVQNSRGEFDAHVALGGQVGLHGHGVFHHQLRSDLAEQVQGGDAGHQSVWIHPFTLTVCSVTNVSTFRVYQSLKLTTN